MDITIKKIKATKGKLVFEYDKKEDGNIPASAHKSTFEEAPEPSFWSAFGYLRADVCKILEVDPGQYARRIVPTGVSCSTNANGYEGAIITCEYHMPQSGTMTTRNTCMTSSTRRYVISRGIEGKADCLTMRSRIRAT